MTPTRSDHCRLRADQQRRLAISAALPHQRLMHERLAQTYAQLARLYLRCQPFRTEADLMTPSKS